MKYFLAPLLILLLGTCVRAQTYVSVERQDSITQAVIEFLAPIDAKYDVVNYKVLYRTTDTQGNPDTASGLLAIPYDRSLQFPMGVYMHGTATDREAVPSRTGVPERLLTDAIAASGYIAVAPDYLGLGDNDGFHPYVHAASEASTGRDLILAARQWLHEQGIPLNDQLFITGYSQGGHAAQALHRNIQELPGNDSLTVTAGAHLSGPYSISGVMRREVFSENPATLPGFIAYTYVSYNNVYGLYDSLGQVFVQPYLDVVQAFNREETDAETFNADLDTLLQSRDEVIADMYQDSIREQLATNDPDNRLIQVLRDNDTYEWAPEAPTLIYYCTGDEQVPFENSIIADSVMRELGSTTVVLESGGPRDHGQCVQPALLTTLQFFEAYATREASTAVGHAVSVPDFGISPNPVGAGSRLRLHGLERYGRIGYQLYDAAGRAVQSGELGEDRSIALRRAGHPGLYLLRVSLPDGNFTVRKVMLR